MGRLLVVGNIAESPFSADIGYYLRQEEHYSDLVSLKSFLNGEFCPRFIVDEASWENIGRKLESYTVMITSTAMSGFSRDELAMRNFLISRAAKDNGADRVILLEPDLFYSAQDRGPRPEHGATPVKRSIQDYKKFDGQPFSARLYADLLKESGTDEVVTVHNHSPSVEHIFMDRFSGYFTNLLPCDVYADYLRDSDIAEVDNMVLCSPDSGASGFCLRLHKALNNPGVKMLKMNKHRSDERTVDVSLAEDSPADIADIAGKDVIVVDDMVRTGTTIIECCRLLKSGNPRRIIFVVTHFYSSREGRITLNDPIIDEIVTTSTIPQILNRDMQGRLRHKMVVLRLGRWISNAVTGLRGIDQASLPGPLYTEDISSKHPRWKGRTGPICGQ
ncbi:phosphoribosyltransferase family protein [Marispirochaeta aestuarii]|uniref:phosphoribosyltransferase family protein n=1 Tax=Marispirochaeta aestuarii TaxID=1963862 RepID=UPI0029C8B610|nr:phosphoribosyltransferase family protein [Marispirochaeta aestuarii]